MNASPTIPAEEQLQALANGLPAFYKLIEKYTGGPIRTDFRQFATVDKVDLAHYLRRDQALAATHVMAEADALTLHDLPVLLREGDGWLVCWIDHGTKTNKTFYSDLSEAAANFIMAYW